MTQKIARTSLTIFKNAEGRWRWVMLSSNAFEDRDGEVISQKALEEDVARADADGDYGPLRWWHIPGFDIGDCDFNAMHGRILVEAGGFKDERLGELIGAKASELSGSIGFFHALDEPDEEGVYHSIRRFERSILPKEAASNPFVQLIVETEEMPMKKEKITEFKKKLGLGADSNLVEKVLELADTAEATAVSEGVRTKEAEAPAAAEIKAETEAKADYPWDECISDQVKAGYSEESAKKICGAIKRDYGGKAVTDAELKEIEKSLGISKEEKAAEETKQADLTAQVSAVSSAVSALTPAFSNGPWTWADTVFDDHVIATREGKAWSIPYTWDDATKTATLSDFSQWTEVERVWQPLTVAAPAGKAAEVSEATKDMVPEAVEVGIEEKAKVTIAAIGTPAAAAVPPEDERVADLTMGQLVKLITEIIAKLEPAAADVAAGKEASEKAAETAMQLKALNEKVEALIGDAPRSVARAIRASQEDSTLLQNQPKEVQEKIAEAGPGPIPDAWAGRFLGAMQKAAGSAEDTPLVLGGPPRQGGA